MSEKYIIKTPSLFKVDDSFQDERFMKVRIAAMHSGKNLNQSRFKTNVIKSAKDTFANIPILANIIITTDENGNKHMDYGSHDMHVEEDFFDSDKYRIIYDEKVVGVVPEHNNFEIIYDEETGNDYVWVDALIYREYGNYCADILESRGGTTDVSAEIGCDEISYDAKDKVLDVNKMTMCAITLLGEDIQPGMVKAHASVFSLDDENREKQIIDIVQELKQSLDKYIASYSEEQQNYRKEDKPQVKKEFENEAEAEVKDTPPAKFDGEGDPEGTDYYEDPTEAAGEETGEQEQETGEQEETEPSADEVAAGEVSTAISALPETITLNDADAIAAARSAYDALTETQQALVTSETLAVLTAAEAALALLQDDDQDDEPGDDTTTTDDDEASVKKRTKTDYSVKYSVKCGKFEKQSFATLSEKLTALSELVNLTYGETDNTWYSVDADEDKKVVYMHDWWCDKHYRQSYSVKKDNYTLVGDRVETFARYLTQDEINEFEKMKSNYSSIQNELAQYKAEPEKMEILNSENYANIADTEEFKAFKEQEAHFSLTVDEVRQKANDMLLEYAMGHEIKFSAKDEPKKTVGMKIFGTTANKKSASRSRYGGFFAK